MATMLILEDVLPIPFLKVRIHARIIVNAHAKVYYSCTWHICLYRHHRWLRIGAMVSVWRYDILQQSTPCWLRGEDAHTNPQAFGWWRQKTIVPDVESCDRCRPRIYVFGAGQTTTPEIVGRPEIPKFQARSFIFIGSFGRRSQNIYLQLILLVAIKN